MKIDKKLEIEFIRAIQKLPNKLTKEEKDAVDKRYSFIHKHFVWTQEVENKMMSHCVSFYVYSIPCNK